MRATALSLLPTFAADIGTEEIRSYLAGISDADPSVRVAAVEALAPFAPEERAQVAAPLLSDKVLAVRIAAARALAAVPPASLSPEQRAAFDAAGAELIAAEKASAERPEAWLSIGAFEAERARPPKPRQPTARRCASIRIGIRIVNLADLYRATGRDGEAEPLLRQAIAAAPDYAPAEHALGLLLVRRQDMPGALAASAKGGRVGAGGRRATPMSMLSASIPWADRRTRWRS